MGNEAAKEGGVQAPGGEASKGGEENGGAIPSSAPHAKLSLAEKKRLKQRTIQAGVALCLWLIAFSGGLLIETEPYRRHLAPNYFAELDAKKKAESNSNKPSDSDDLIAQIIELISPQKEKKEEYTTVAFVSSLLWHTPSNLAIIALLAGFIGGCGSNIAAIEQSGLKLDISSVRKQYMNESPWSAMIRSFIVYLTVIAGLYLVVEDPFDSPTPSKFIKLAGTISVLGVLVGYDPSRFSSFVGTIPNNLPSKLPPNNKATDETTPDLQFGVKRTLTEEAVITKNQAAPAAKVAPEAPADPLAPADDKLKQP